MELIKHKYNYVIDSTRTFYGNFCIGESMQHKKLLLVLVFLNSYEPASTRNTDVSLHPEVFRVSYSQKIEYSYFLTKVPSRRWGREIGLEIVLSF